LKKTKAELENAISVSVLGQNGVRFELVTLSRNFES